MAVLSLGDALQSFAKSEIDRVTDAQSITVESRTWHVVDSEWEPIRNVARLTEDDFEQMAAALPEAKGAWMTRTLRARNVEDVEALESGIQDWLAQRYPNWEDRFELIMAEEMLKEIELVFTVLKAFLGTLASISMIVGGIGIMNIMLASVTERTREIGIRKAIGASRRDIQLQFLTEAVAISFVGSGIGMVTGLSIAWIAVAVMRRVVEEDSLAVVVSPYTLMLSAGIAVLVGLTFGTYPARRASRLSPIEAIRHE